jgi:hypothetical protein
MIDKIQYAVSEIRKNGDDLDWWHQRFQSRIAGPGLGMIHGQGGVDVMAEDWDNLLVLDACRADMFEEVLGTSQFDDYRRVHSRGSSSPEWMEENFQGESFGDTVYVTANPWISKVAPDAFHDIVNIWVQDRGLSETKLRDAITLKDLGVSPGSTITPDQVNEVTKDVAQQYPNKRLLVHYFQPHAPCIGRPDGTQKDDDEIDIDLHPGSTLKNGVVSHDEVWEAYADNTQYVYQYAKDLAEALGGKSVMTADHGEMFGEWLWPFPMRGYAHPSGVRHPKLIEVPWAVTSGEERRNIVAEDVTSHEADEDEIDERLRSLGYKV